jgi:mono/diheme cytochrome c family protein
MPAVVPRVREGDVPALVAFVRLLSPGFEQYSRYCAACHGDDGRSVATFTEGISVPTTIFDRAYFTRHDPEEVRAKVWHMVGEQKPAMPHMRAKLSEPEARAIITYLKRTN